MKKKYIQPTIKNINLGQELCEGFGAANSVVMGPDDALQNRVFIDLDDEDDNYDYATGKWF